MSLSAGRSCSRLFSHVASTAVTAVNHPHRSPPASWQAVNGYQRPHHVSTLHTITNSLSLSPLFLFVSARSPVFSAMFEHEMEESKKVSRALDCVVLASPRWQVECVLILIFLCVASGSTHLPKHPSVSASVPSCLVDCNSIIWFP